LSLFVKAFAAKESNHLLPLGDDEMRGPKEQTVKPDQEIKQYGGHRENDVKTLLFMHSWVFWLQKRETDFPLLDKIFPFWVLKKNSKKPMSVYLRRYGMSRHNLSSLKGFFFFYPSLRGLK